MRLRCDANGAVAHAQATLTPPARRSFSTLWTRGKKHFSEVFFVGGCPWRLSLYPRCATPNARGRLLLPPATRRPQRPLRPRCGLPARPAHAHTRPASAAAARGEILTACVRAFACACVCVCVCSGNTAVKGSRDHVAIYLEAADSASAPTGWKRYVDFRLGVVSQTARAAPARGAPTLRVAPTTKSPD